jgi:hypothetical protein
VNEVGLEGYCPIHFKDLRATIALGWAWFRRRVSVAVRTAISVQRENGGRESDLKLKFPQHPSILDRGASRVADSIKTPRAHRSKNVALFR